jgi:hypothetical protein
MFKHQTDFDFNSDEIADTFSTTLYQIAHKSFPATKISSYNVLQYIETMVQR